MEGENRAAVGQDLRTLWDGGATGPLDDGELLARFLRGGDSAGPAFAALVDRHARMVLRACRSVLGDPHDAQDSAQATFLVLARTAASIRRPEALPSWLHGTARRVATRALRDAIVRRRHERRSSVQRPEAGEPARSWPELHEEIDRLPDRYRSAIVLCDLSGLTHEQAASRLGCPARTLQTRLYRGRERLKDRLIRRGLAPAAVAAALASGSEAPAAAPAWVASTAGMARSLSEDAGWSAAGEVPGRIARSYLKGMKMANLKMTVGAGLLVGIATAGAWSVMAREPGKIPAAPVDLTGTVESDQAPPGPHPITITGRAFDPDGNPAANARITLASTSPSHSSKVAEARTGPDGRYEFRDAPLPIEPATTNKGRDRGSFQVFGQADGLGFAWRPQKSFYPKEAPEPALEFDPPGAFEPGQKIDLDLHFTRAATLRGVVTGEKGEAIAGVRLELYDCVVPEVRNCIGCWSLDILNHAVPDAMRIRTTDAAGRFQFEDMPEGCRFRIILRSRGRPDRTVYAGTFDEAQPDHDNSPVLTGDLKITLSSAVAVPIRLIRGDTGGPAEKAFVQAGGSSGITDKDGRASLDLAPGVYAMQNWPAVGTPYLVSGGKLEVGARAPAGPVPATLDPAAFVEVTVMEAETGRGIADVDIWRLQGENVDERTDLVGRKPVIVRSFQAPSLVRRDRPRTDATGKARFPIEPGRRTIGVGMESFPPDREVVEAAGQEVECRAGTTAPLRFTLRKKP